MNLEAVEEGLRQLENADVVGAEELEAFKRALPIEPQTAELVEKALPFPWSDVFEYVGPASNGRRAHWRVKPRRDTAGHRRSQARFADAARRSTGTRGTVERDGDIVPASADRVARTVEQRDGADTGTGAGSVGQKALSRLRDVLDV